MTRLEAIRQRVERATPAPWEQDRLGDIWNRRPDGQYWLVDLRKKTADGWFIIHSREDIPALLAVVEAIIGHNMSGNYTHDHLLWWADGLVRSGQFVEDSQLVVWLRGVANVLAPLLQSVDAENSE